MAKSALIFRQKLFDREDNIETLCILTDPGDLALSLINLIRILTQTIKLTLNLNRTIN